jgi:hypothetical protein
MPAVPFPGGDHEPVTGSGAEPRRFRHMGFQLPLYCATTAGEATQNLASSIVAAVPGAHGGRTGPRTTPRTNPETRPLTSGGFP